MTYRSKLLVAALAVAAAAPALAARPELKVKEQIDIAAPPAKVWEVISSFDNLGWHPAVGSTSLDKGKNNTKGAVRTVTTKDGAKLVEELVAYKAAAHSYTYRIIDSPLPVSGYVSTLTIKPAKGGSHVEWSSTFRRKDEKPAEGADDAGARKAVSGIYTSGLDALKKQLEAH
ncbi:MAG: SRPBCC family protein [Proteobacteria bacterium]|nr:SRPBCC family protein [Pseudomonadota bacterium]